MKRAKWQPIKFDYTHGVVKEEIWYAKNEGSGYPSGTRIRKLSAEAILAYKHGFHDGIKNVQVSIKTTLDI